MSHNPSPSSPTFQAQPDNAASSSNPLAAHIGITGEHPNANEDELVTIPKTVDNAATSASPPSTTHPEHAVRNPVPSSQKLHLARQTIDLLREMKTMLQTLSKSSIVGPADQPMRAQFWEVYKVEAEEFHIDFLAKHNSSLDNALIFTGLFCGVNATFLVLMQPSLGPDPNVTTQALLMMIVHSLNNTAFGDQALVLPQFDGPNRLTIWVQCLLYASLAASLFAALGAVLGKQWLSHYATVGEKGTVEQRCIDRQRKSVGLQTWHFRAVLAFIPLLLQVSLFLFIGGMAAYLWDQQRAISAILIAAGVLVTFLYLFTLMSSLLYSDSPFYTPISDALITLSRGRTLTWVGYIKRQWDSLKWPNQVRGYWRRSVMDLLPIVQRGRSFPNNMAGGAHQGPAIVDMVLNEPRSSLLRPVNEGDRFQGDLTLATVPEEAKEHQELDASCVDWLLVTTTKPDVVAIAARMVLGVSWGDNTQIDPIPMLQQLRDAFISCFLFKREFNIFNLGPRSDDRALACGQAILHLYFQRGRLRSSSSRDPIADIDNLLKESKDFVTICQHNDVSSDNPDLYLVMLGLRTLTDPSYPFSQDRGTRAALETTDSLNEWISDQVLQCLSSPTTSDHIRLYMLDVILGQFRRGLHASYRHIYYRYFLACACAMGYEPMSGELSTVGMKTRIKKGLEVMLTKIASIISSYLHSGSSQIDRVHLAFAWELMGSLTWLMDEDSFREVVHAQKLHHLAISLCRETLRRTFPDKKLWPSIALWVRISVEATNHPLNGDARRTLTHDDSVLREVWQCHYDSSDGDILAPADINWLILIMRMPKTALQIHVDSKSDYPEAARTVAYCLALLSVSTEIASTSYSHTCYDDVAWALQRGSLLGQAGLKLARAMCGSGRDVELGLLTNIVQSIANFSPSLHQLAHPFYSSNSTNAHEPESYLFHIAYLDFAWGLSRLQDDPIQRMAHLRNCLNLALFLWGPRSHRWYVQESSMVQTCLGRETDYRPWKETLPNPALLSASTYPNTYIRDICYRLVQIVAKHLQAKLELPSFTGYESDRMNSNVSLALACAPWQIYGTHPLPDDTLSTMSQLMADVLSNSRGSPLDKEWNTKHIFGFISEAIRPDNLSNLPSPENKKPWFLALQVLRPHVDEGLRLKYPPTEEELRMHGLEPDKGKDYTSRRSPL